MNYTFGDGSIALARFTGKPMIPQPGDRPLDLKATCEPGLSNFTIQNNNST